MKLKLKHITTILAPSITNLMRAVTIMYTTSCSSMVLGVTPQFLPAAIL